MTALAIRDTIEIQAASWADGFRKLEGLLEGMFRQVEQPQLRPDDWQATVELLQQLHEQYFVTQSDPLGRPWQPLSPYTVAMKGRSTILIDTSDLVNSLTSSGHPMAIRDFGADQMSFGTNRPHAWKHQQGQPGQNLPQRQHTGLGEQNLQYVDEVMADTAVQLMFEYRL